MTLEEALAKAGIKTEGDLQFPKTNEAMEIIKKYQNVYNLFIHGEYKSVWINVTKH